MAYHQGWTVRIRPTLFWILILGILSLVSAPPVEAEKVVPAPASSKSEPAAQPRPPVSEPALKNATTPQTGPKVAAPPASNKSEATADSGMTLRGGKDRTDLRSLTVEGEDRVHLEIERPPLVMDLNPERIGGLESGTAGDILNRVPPDLMTPYLAGSGLGMSPYVAHPWLRQFTTGSVARFQPSVKDVERWKLVVADSKGQTVMTYEGKGDPPREIAWDGRSSEGTLVSPGITYSHIFEAYDRAGNKRNFVGEGFSVVAYRLDSPDGQALVFSGQSLLSSQGGKAAGTSTAGASKGVSPLLIEAAGWLNQAPIGDQPIRVTATARTLEQAQLLAGRVTAAFTELALCDPSRIRAVTEVAPDAPDGGTVRIGASPLNSPDIRSNSKAR